MKINIIGDIAGRYDELLLLLEKMPEADLILSIGDMVDRGPKSKEVLEWFMNNDKADAIYGNHEDMMVQSMKHGNCSDWLRNGGWATCKSFSPDAENITEVLVDKDIIDWLETRPMYFQTDDLFVSHAPITSLDNIPSDPLGRDYFFYWNRYTPKKPQSKFVINGHNGMFKEYKDGAGEVYGMCLDNSHTGRLTGITWPSKELFQQEFLDYGENESYYNVDSSDIDS